MSSEFYDEEAAVEELKTRLRQIKSSLKPLIKDGLVDAAQVPKSVREEIVQILDEHGGIDLLSALTKLTYNTLNLWHRRWQYNPYIYRTPCDIVKARKTRTLIRKVLKPSTGEEKLTKSQRLITKDSTVEDRVFSTITAQQEQMIKKIKSLMEEKMKNGIPFDEELENEVKELYKEIGDTREIAILLGISKSTVDEWVFDMEYEEED
jgi:hypothetical protein